MIFCLLELFGSMEGNGCISTKLLPFALASFPQSNFSFIVYLMRKEGG